MAAPNAHSADDLSPNARYYTQQQQQQTRQWHVPGYQHHPTALAQPSSTTVSPAPIATGATPTSLSIAQAWLQSAIPDLQIAPPHIIPGINPSYYLIQTQGMNTLYLPCHAWNVRYLSPQGRHELFIELREFARVMRDNTPASAEYGCAFELVVERSDEVHRKEMIWYACFSDERNGTLAQRQLRYTTIVMNQAQATGIGNFAPGGDGRGDTSTSLTQRTSNASQSGSSLGSALTIDNDEGPKLVSEATDRVSGPTAPQGKKRPSPYADPEEDSPVAKKTKMDVDDMIQAEVDRMIREGKEAKAKADHQRYLDHQDTINNYYLEGDKNRKLSDHEWQKLAVWDSRGGSISTPKPKQSPSRRQGEPYDSDIAKCPLLPSRDLKSYPVKRGDIYMCFHLDNACGGQDTCSEPSHECCRKGLALRELEKKVELKEERACRRIEELAFKDGKLDKRHKTWPNYFSKALRDRDMNRIKAQVQPLGWTQASRDLAETRMSRVARPVPVEPSRRKVQHVGLKQPQPPQAAIQNQRQQVVGPGKGGASSRPLSNAKGKGPAPPVRQTESPSPTGSLSQGKTKTQLSQPRAVASEIPHSHQMPVDLQASQNTPQYRASISTTAPIMTSTSAVQTVSVQRNITGKSKLTAPVVPKPAENLGKEMTNSLNCRQLCPASANPYQLAAMEIVKKQVVQKEPITVAGIKISKAEVNEGMMGCVRRVAKALRVEAEQREVETASQNGAEPIACDDEKAAWHNGSSGELCVGDFAPNTSSPANESACHYQEKSTPGVQVPSQTQDGKTDSIFDSDGDIEMRYTSENCLPTTQEDIVFDRNEVDPLAAPESWYQRDAFQSFAGMTDDPYSVPAVATTEELNSWEIRAAFLATASWDNPH